MNLPPSPRFRALHPHARPLARAVSLAVPAQLPGMGTLFGLEVGDLADPDHVEEWWFSKPYPRLAFEHVSPDAGASRRVSRLWCVGGAWRIDARGKFHGGGRVSRMKVTRALSPRGEVASRYRDTHGGREGTEWVSADVSPRGAVVPVKWCRAVIYHADKRERTDRDPADYRHPFAPHARPLLAVDEPGTTLLFLSDRDLGAVHYASPDGAREYRASRFGRYTVTPHGVEDLAGG